MKAFYLGRIDICSAFCVLFGKPPEDRFYPEVTEQGFRLSQTLPWWSSSYFRVRSAGVWHTLRRLSCECPCREDLYGCCGSTVRGFHQITLWCRVTNLMPTGLGCNPSSPPAARAWGAGSARTCSEYLHLPSRCTSQLSLNTLSCFSYKFSSILGAVLDTSGAFQSLDKYPDGLNLTVVVHTEAVS